jgi:hypothetical protein
MIPFICLPCPFLGIKHCTGILFKNTKIMSKNLGLIAENIQSLFTVHLKFCKPVPMCKVKQKLENLIIVGLWEKAFENRNCGLKGL